MFFLIPVAVFLFAFFPLTDTDIWWHLACAREWVTTWTPVREPVVNVHEFFQQVVQLVYECGGANDGAALCDGAQILVIFKAVLWGSVFALFLWPVRRKICALQMQQSSMRLSRLCVLLAVILLLFVFRFQFEMRPVVFSLLFLGVYWNVLPPLFERRWNLCRTVAVAVALLVLQWFWCKCQGLYILGPLLALLTWGVSRRCAARAVTAETAPAQIAILRGVTLRTVAECAFVVLLFLMPLLHREGVNLLLYPFGLLNRLLGMSPSAAVFAKEIAENRSPISLLLSGENVLQSALTVALCVAALVAIAMAAVKFRALKNAQMLNARVMWLLLMAVLAIVAERNLVLFLPVALCVALEFASRLPLKVAIPARVQMLIAVSGFAMILGFWCKSLLAYDSAVAYQRVPVSAAVWMGAHPHEGRLFNDDRAGGYLALVNPSDSIFIDGRFILKTADFFERYLRYSREPELFLHDADSLNVGRAIFPLQYYARWNGVLNSLSNASNWHLVYRDDFFAVIDRVY